MSRGASMGRSFGLEIEEISIDQAKEKYPLLDTKYAKAAWFLPQDGQINPVDITMCLAKEAKRMGAKISVNNDEAIVNGVQKLKGSKVMASDLRASMCLILGALAASGTSEIDGVFHLDRGYENLENKLSNLGANIKRSM